jgi:hypothetical protein
VDAVDGSRHSAEVAQAQGMVCAQVDCTLAEALMLMNARARTSHMSLEQVAAGIVHHLIRFDDE